MRVIWGSRWSVWDDWWLVVLFLMPFAIDSGLGREKGAWGFLGGSVWGACVFSY